MKRKRNYLSNQGSEGDVQWSPQKIGTLDLSKLQGQALCLGGQHRVRRDSKDYNIITLDTCFKSPILHHQKSHFFHITYCKMVRWVKNITIPIWGSQLLNNRQSPLHHTNKPTPPSENNTICHAYSIQKPTLFEIPYSVGLSYYSKPVVVVVRLIVFSYSWNTINLPTIPTSTS